jgi:hypothetical protein
LFVAVADAAYSREVGVARRTLFYLTSIVR